jgi:nitronate monooxygenase
MALGASGAVFGTRFLLTPESLYTDDQRRALVTAKEGSTVRTLAFDRVRGTLGWPEGVDGRALRNSTVEDCDKGIDFEEVKTKFVEGVKAGDSDRMLVWAGTGIGQMNSIQPAAACIFILRRTFFG